MKLIIQYDENNEIIGKAKIEKGTPSIEWVSENRRYNKEYQRIIDIPKKDEKLTLGELAEKYGRANE